MAPGVEVPVVAVVNQSLRTDVTFAQALVAGDVMYVQLFAGKQCITDLLVDVLVDRSAGSAKDADAVCQFAEVDAAFFGQP